MAEPATQWIPNTSYESGEITYDDSGTTYDSSTTYYDGAAPANIVPVSTSQPAEWS